MRRTAIAVAVMVTVLMVAPSIGAQCKPDCGQDPGETVDEIFTFPRDAIWTDNVDDADGPTPKMETAGPVLP